MYNWNDSRVMLSARQSLEFFQCVRENSRKKISNNAQPGMIEPRALRVHGPARAIPNQISAFQGSNPMPFSMSQASLPVFEIGLNALSAVLDKAAAHSAAKKIDQSVLIGWRLAPDMFALGRQVQVA